MTQPQSAMHDRRWAGLALLFLAQMMVIGATSYSFGLFVGPLSESFNLSRAEANIGLMLMLIGMAIWSPLIGKALDRHPAKWILIAGALSFAIGALIIAFSHNLVISGLAAFTFLAGGTAALGPLASSTLTMRWFSPAPTGRAIGIIAVSASAGGFAIVPLLSWIIEISDWRGAIATAGICVALILPPLALIIIKSEPKKSSPIATSKAQPSAPLALFTSRNFWSLIVVIGTMMAISQSILASLIPYAGDHGLSPAQAASLISVTAASSIAGKLLIGFLLDKVDVRLLQLGVILILLAFLAILLWAPSYPMLLMGCVAGGIATGGSLPLWTAFIGQFFGIQVIGRVMGMMTLVQMPIILFSVHFIGAVHDRNGSYDIAFFTFCAAVPVMAGALLLMKRPQSPS